MARFNDTMINGILDVTDQVVLSEKKYNFGQYVGDTLIISQENINTKLLGNNLTIQATKILSMLGVNCSISTDTNGKISISCNSLDARASGSVYIGSTGSTVEINGKSGITVRGDGTTGVSLDGTRLSIPNASFGTADPSDANARNGQIYFKIIS